MYKEKCKTANRRFFNYDLLRMLPLLILLVTTGIATSFATNIGLSPSTPSLNFSVSIHSSKSLIASIWDFNPVVLLNSIPFEFSRTGPSGMVFASFNHSLGSSL